VISGFCRKVDENCFLLGHHTVSNGNSLPTFQDNQGCVISQKNAILIFLSESFFFQEKILEELQTIPQKMCNVGKLKKLQNTNKMLLFLTRPSERYGKLYLCYLSLYEQEPFFSWLTYLTQRPAMSNVLSSSTSFRKCCWDSIYPICSAFYCYCHTYTFHT